MKYYILIFLVVKLFDSLLNYDLIHYKILSYFKGGYKTIQSNMQVSWSFWKL